MKDETKAKAELKHQEPHAGSQTLRGKNHIQKHSWKEKGNTEDWRHSLCFGDALQENLLPKGIHSHSPWKSGLFLSLGQLFVYLCMYFGCAASLLLHADFL